MGSEVEDKPKSAKLSPFDIAKNINLHGERLDADYVGYLPYMLNRIYSNTPDTIHFANEMNRYWGLDKQIQYDFYRYGLNKNPRRFGKWEKRSEENADDLELIKEAFKVTRAKAIELHPILKSEMELIKAHLRKGGKK